METAARSFDLRDAHDRMAAAMGARGRVLVAFSGGVDSGLVARVAHDALGDNALAVLADAESLARWELAEAISEAAEIGIRLETVRVSELANDRYVANPANRCYFCRQELGAALKPLASKQGFAAIADGVNVSDLGDHRPGIQAMNEAGFWHPLVEFGFRKADVRALARELHLSFFDKPSNACLSSRIAYGEVITVEKLQRVEAAEGAIRALGFRVVRVRAHDGIARIEVPREDLLRMSETAMAEKVVEAVRNAGFAYAGEDGGDPIILPRMRGGPGRNPGIGASGAPVLVDGSGPEIPSPSVELWRANPKTRRWGSPRTPAAYAAPIASPSPRL